MVRWLLAQLDADERSTDDPAMSDERARRIMAEVAFWRMLLRTEGVEMARKCVQRYAGRDGFREEWVV